MRANARLFILPRKANSPGAERNLRAASSCRIPAMRESAQLVLRRVISSYVQLEYVRDTSSNISVDNQQRSGLDGKDEETHVSTVILS